jgi:hypothetical protein
MICTEMFFIFKKNTGAWECRKCAVGKGGECGKRQGKVTAQLGFHEAVRAKQSFERKMGGGSARPSLMMLAGNL